MTTAEVRLDEERGKFRPQYWPSDDAKRGEHVNSLRSASASRKSRPPKEIRECRFNELPHN
jgi:hypothetical protein